MQCEYKAAQPTGGASKARWPADATTPQGSFQMASPLEAQPFLCEHNAAVNMAAKDKQIASISVRQVNNLVNRFQHIGSPIGIDMTM